MVYSAWSILVLSVVKVWSESADSVSMNPGVVTEPTAVPGAVPGGTTPGVTTPGVTTPGATSWVLTVPVLSGAGGRSVASATVVIDWVPVMMAPV